LTLDIIHNGLTGEEDYEEKLQRDVNNKLSNDEGPATSKKKLLLKTSATALEC